YAGELLSLLDRLADRLAALGQKRRKLLPAFAEHALRKRVSLLNVWERRKDVSKLLQRLDRLLRRDPDRAEELGLLAQFDGHPCDRLRDAIEVRPALLRREGQTRQVLRRDARHPRYVRELVEDLDLLFGHYRDCRAGSHGRGCDSGDGDARLRRVRNHLVVRFSNEQRRIRSSDLLVASALQRQPIQRGLSRALSE